MPRLAFLCALAALSAGCGIRSERPRPASLTLWIGGDVHRAANEGPLFDPKPSFLGAAAGVVNLEGPVAEHAAPADSGRELHLFNSPRSLLELAEAGVRVAGIANNHALDSGAEGFARTRFELTSLGIHPAGLGAGPAFLEDRGLKVAITAHDLSNGVPHTLDAELRFAHARAEILVATFHVTAPALYAKTPEMLEAADIALGAGARVIAFHGTHALGAVERRGSAVIAWGLGNLVFDCECTDERDGALLQVELTADDVDAAVIPIRAGLHGEPARVAEDADEVFSLLESLGSPHLRRVDGRGFF